MRLPNGLRTLWKSFRKESPPVAGQQAVVGTNRLGPFLTRYDKDGRMLAYRLDDVSLADLDRVRQDPVVRSSLRLLKLPILRCDWNVYSEDEEIAAFVRAVLDPHMYDLLWAMLTAFDFGVAFIEKVWSVQPVFETTLTQASSPAQKRLQWRNAWVIERFAHLDPSITWALVYPTGEFAGVRQMVGATQGLDIEEGRLIQFAVDSEFNEVYGNPMIKACIPYFELKQKALSDMATYYATYAVPTKKGWAPPGETPLGVDENGNPVTVRNLDFLAEQLDKLANAHSIVLPAMYDANGQRMWDVEAFEVPPPVSMEQYIQFLDEQMRQALHVPSLASVHPIRGTYSLGQAQIDLFITNEEAYIAQIESVLNRDLVPDIVRYNFGSRAHARLSLQLDNAYMKRLAESMVQQLAAGQPVQTADGDVLTVDWLKVAQDVSIPIQVRAPSEMPHLFGQPADAGEDGFGGASDGKSETDIGEYLRGLGMDAAGAGDDRARMRVAFRGRNGDADDYR